MAAKDYSKGGTRKMSKSKQKRLAKAARKKQKKSVNPIVHAALVGALDSPKGKYQRVTDIMYKNVFEDKNPIAEGDWYDILDPLGLKGFGPRGVGPKDRPSRTTLMTIERMRRLGVMVGEPQRPYNPKPFANYAYDSVKPGGYTSYVASLMLDKRMWAIYIGKELISILSDSEASSFMDAMKRNLKLKVRLLRSS